MKKIKIRTSKMDRKQLFYSYGITEFDPFSLTRLKILKRLAVTSKKITNCW